MALLMYGQMDQTVYNSSPPAFASAEFVFFSSNSSSYFPRFSCLPVSIVAFSDLSYSFASFGSSMPSYILRNYFIYKNSKNIHTSWSLCQYKIYANKKNPKIPMICEEFGCGIQLVYLANYFFSLISKYN